MADSHASYYMNYLAIMSLNLKLVAWVKLEHSGFSCGASQKKKEIAVV